MINKQDVLQILQAAIDGINALEDQGSPDVAALLAQIAQLEADKVSLQAEVDAKAAMLAQVQADLDAAKALLASVDLKAKEIDAAIADPA